MTLTAELTQRYSGQWNAMTHHTFITQVAERSIALENFNKWLVQDYLYVKGLVGFLGSLIARAPDSLTAPLGAAVGVLGDELTLFEQMARELGAELKGAELSPNCQHYMYFLDSVASRHGFLAGLAVYWAMEKAYLDSWRVVREESSEAAEWQAFVIQWTKPEFAQWVEFIGGEADRLAEGVSEAERELIAGLFLRVIQYECLFWDIAVTDSRWPV